MAKSDKPIYELTQKQQGKMAFTEEENREQPLENDHWVISSYDSIHVRKMNIFEASVYTLRHRRGLYVFAFMLSFGIIFIVSLVIMLLHLTDPSKFTTLGGLDKFGALSTIIAFFTSVAGVVLGATAGASDLSIGVLRNLVATGRSRIALFASGLLASVRVIFELMIVTLLAFGVASYFSRPNHSALTFSIMLRVDLWVILDVLTWTIISFGIANLFSSRSIAIGVILVGDLVLGGILSSFSSYPGWRQAFVGVTLRQIMPAALQPGATTNRIETGWQAIIVIVLWLGVALFLGARRAQKREL